MHSLEITHPNEVCMDSCGAFASLLWDALETGELVFDRMARTATTKEVRDCIERSGREAPPKMSGWVLDTLTGALWAVRGAPSFADAVWRAVSLGHDADTVAAVAGALAGTRWGASAIPVTLTSQLQSRHPMFAGDYPAVLEELADDLMRARTNCTDGERRRRSELKVRPDIKGSGMNSRATAKVEA